MDDRTKSILITLIAVLLFLFPGLGFICLGLASLVYGYFIPSNFNNEPNRLIGFSAGGVCIGLLLILLAVVIIVIAFRRKNQSPTLGTSVIPREPPPGEAITPRQAYQPEDSVPDEEMRPPITPQESVPPGPRQEPTPPEQPVTPEEPTPPIGPNPT